jgi:hypothetical protein
LEAVEQAYILAIQSLLEPEKLALLILAAVAAAEFMVVQIRLVRVAQV